MRLWRECRAGVSRKRRSLAAALWPVAAVALLQAPAAAADRPVFDWSGLYLGGHVGYARGLDRNTLFDPAAMPISSSFGSLYGGAQIGYNHVFASRFVLGVEADISFPNFLEDGITTRRTTAVGSEITRQVDYLATLRARLGYAFDRWLVYGTGGLAFTQARLVETPGVVRADDKLLPTRLGWTVGAGVEWAVWSNLSAKIEYDYLSFANKPVALDPVVAFAGAGQLVVNVEHSIQTVKAGLNWRFGPTAAPVAARY